MRAALLASAAALTLTACNAPPPTFGQLPQFALTAVTQDGARPFSRADLAGRAWVADFIFTSCEGPCPALSERMARLQKTLPAGVGLLSFTVDPDRDDAQALAAYAKRYQADPKRWLFITGPKAALIPLLTQGFKLPAVEDSAAPSGRRVAHSTRFALVDGKARVRGYFDGEDEAELAALGRAAKAL